MSDDESPDAPIMLQLGDIVKIRSSSNAEINDETFMISFISNKEIDLVSRERRVLNLLLAEDGEIVNDDIDGIDLVDRADNASYAVQNGLVPGKWVNIHFDTDVPTTVTGEITQLEEDQITLSLTTGDEIYIDFRFQGLPRDLPISRIELRAAPVSQKGESKVIDEGDAEQEQIVFDEEELNLGESLGTLKMEVEVDEKSKRYSISRQCTDLLNELLSTLNIRDRTVSRMNRINTDVQRFSELLTGENEIVNKYPGLRESLFSLTSVPRWIYPASRINKNIYDIEESEGQYYKDIIVIEKSALSVQKMVEIEKLFKSSGAPSPQSSYNKYVTDIAIQETPFTNNQDGIITSIGLATSIESLVDNSPEFETTTVNNDELGTKKFFVQKYLAPPTSLQSTQDESGREYERRALNRATETMSIASILCLPHKYAEAFTYNSPVPNLKNRIEINRQELLLSNILADSTTPEYVTVGTSVLQDSNSFTTPVNYVPAEGISYFDFVSKITPSAWQAFKSSMRGDQDLLSITKIVNHLFGFNIYYSSLTPDDYAQFSSFIKESIREWLSTFNDREEEINSTLAEVTSEKYETILEKGLIEKAVAGYGLKLSDIYTSSDLLLKSNAIDNGRLLQALVSLSNLYLISIEDYEEEDDIARKNYASTDCLKKVYKSYSSRKELNDDFGKTIYRDPDLDDTDYDIIDKYAHIVSKPSADKERLLADALEEVDGMDPLKAKKEAAALLDGRRQIADGDYAILKISPTDEPIFFIRKDAIWIERNINESDCDLKADCVSIKQSCKTMNGAKIDLIKQLTEKQNTNFDEVVSQEVGLLRAKLENNVKERLANINRLKAYRFRTALRYDLAKARIGLIENDSVAVKSPYAKLLSSILAQGDFVTRQSNILRFCLKFARSAMGDESPMWLYCNDSGSKLIPSFLLELATTFQQGDDYVVKLNEIIAQRGTLGSDGEAVVDKYSGWEITMIETDSSEGYTIDGFREKTRDILPQDLETEVIESQPVSEEEIVILKVLNAMCKFLGIPIKEIREFVLAEALKTYEKQMPDEAEYEKMIKKRQAKGKKVTPYEVVSNQTLIVITLSYLILAIQTSTPRIATRKVVPGCVKSFSGYPVYSADDMSGITYIACVADTIKSSIPPWNSIKKISAAKLVKQMEMTLNKYILGTDIVLRKVALAEDEQVLAPREPEVWDTFLPPQKQTGASYSPVSTDFKSLLIANISKGQRESTAQINNLRGKVIIGSHQIMDAINKSVTDYINSGSVVLTTNEGLPYLENACCWSKDPKIFDYFSRRDPSLVSTNEQMAAIGSTIREIEWSSTAPFLFDATDTRIVYPKVDMQFRENTIYKAFIYYCKFGVPSILDPRLEAICGESEFSFDKQADIADKIAILKSEGKQFDIRSLDALMNFINNKRIVPIKHEEPFDPISETLSILEVHPDNDVVPTQFINLMYYAAESKDKVREFRNYMLSSIDLMHRKIKNFLESTGSSDIVKDLNRIIEQLRLPTRSIKDYQNSLNILNAASAVFPAIIVNGVSYSANDIDLPGYDNLSAYHYDDLRKTIAKYYRFLSTFIGNKTIEILLKEFQGRMLPYSIMTSLPIFSCFGEGITVSEVMTFLFLNTILVLIDTTKDEQASKGLLKFKAITAEQSSEMQDNQLEDDDDLQDISIDRLKGAVENNRKVISSFIGAVVKTLIEDVKIQDKSYNEINSEALKAKEREKNQIVEKLTEMTDEKRNIENMFKSHKLGDWSVGLQKGYKVYDASVYDAERLQMLTAAQGAINVSDLMRIEEETIITNEINQELDNDIMEYQGEDDNYQDDKFDELF